MPSNRVSRRGMMSQKASLLLAVCWLVYGHSIYIVSSAHGFSDDHNYTRDKVYPEYCSIPEQMDQRTIPLLQSDVPVGETRLAQVTAIIRHGARTPLFKQCWDGFWDPGADTSVWDCQLRSYLGTPPPEIISEEEGETPELGELGFLLFEKRYDALLNQNGTFGNVLHGTCQEGQLIQKGYDQMIKSGEILKDAYLYNPKTGDHNVRLKLMPQDYESINVYLRSDDEQRTLMSGQVLLRGMFGGSAGGSDPFVAHHVGDQDREVLSANFNICPRMDELETEALHSSEFQDFNMSSEARELREFMENEFGRTMESISDCLMSTICNDLTLPESINDFDGSGSGQFQRLLDFGIQQKTLAALYDDAALAKLAMGPLWAEIMDILVAAADEDSEDGSYPRFALFSGHDSTIIPLMASLGSRVWNRTDWPTYAAMMVIEVHEIVGDRGVDRSIFRSNFAFRLLYNGQVLTSLIDGCNAQYDLCDWNIFQKRVQPFATFSRDCQIRGDETSRGSMLSWSDVTGTGLVETPRDIFLLVMWMLLSAFSGFVTTCWCFTRRSPFTYDQVEQEPLSDLALTECD